MKKGVLWFFLLGISVCGVSCNEEETDPPCGTSLSKFTGIWDMNEHCGSSDFQYPLTISEVSGKIRLSNLGGLGPNAVVDATVSGSTFSFSQQVQSAIFIGNGSLNGGCTQLVLTWDGGPNGNCTGTGNR
ncbi:MAG TPA: hypothetical protein VNJ07_01160 [Chitinophagales bacterium]|nr:hypothetical protein [Chitinophagales bacterium]